MILIASVNRCLLCISEEMSRGTQVDWSSSSGRFFRTCNSGRKGYYDLIYIFG